MSWVCAGGGDGIGGVRHNETMLATLCNIWPFICSTHPPHSHEGRDQLIRSKSGKERAVFRFCFGDQILVIKSCRFKI